MQIYVFCCFLCHDVLFCGALFCLNAMNKEDMKDLEYFKDDHFRGWDARHNAEAERTLLRVLASKVWRNALMKPLGELKWHNPLMSSELVNANLLSQTACISGIRCV